MIQICWKMVKCIKKDIKNTLTDDRKEGGRRMEDVKKNENEMEESVTEEKETIQEMTETASETTEKKWTGKRIRSLCLELLLYVFIIVTCTTLVPKYVVMRTVVDGESMENTLQDKDNILLEKLSYRFGEPERFDIVVFYHFFDKKKQDRKNEKAYDFYVKRIIGLPGETVQIVGDTIYINGEVLEEDYGKDPIDDPGRASEPIVLGEDEYFVLGDNREVSIDSRDSDVGNVKREWIEGKVWIRTLPLNHFGTID